MVESIEQLVATRAKDGVAENMQDDVLVICCLTEVFAGPNKVLLGQAKQSSIIWAQKLADLAKRLPNFTFVGPRSDQTWSCQGFTELVKPIMKIISGCSHPILNPCQYMQEIPHLDKWHFNGEEKSKSLTWELIPMIMHISHALQQLEALYEQNLARISPMIATDDWPSIESSAKQRLLREDPTLSQHMWRHEQVLNPLPAGMQDNETVANPLSDTTVIRQTLAQLSQQFAGTTPQPVTMTQDQLALAPNLAPASDGSAQMSIGLASRADAQGFPRDDRDSEAEILRRSNRARFVVPPTIQGCFFRARDDVPYWPDTENVEARCAAWTAPCFGQYVCTIPPGGWFGPVLEVFVQDQMPRQMRGLCVRVPIMAEFGYPLALTSDVWVNICCEEVQFARQEFRMGGPAQDDNPASGSSAEQWKALTDSPSLALLYHI